MSLETQDFDFSESKQICPNLNHYCRNPTKFAQI